MDAAQIKAKIIGLVENDDWTPATEYSVFSQHDSSFYTKRRDDFIHKYRTLKAIATVLKPETITEMGCFAAYALHAYCAGNPGVRHYTGYDIFPDVVHEVTQLPWGIQEAAQRTIEAAGVSYDLEKGDLRDRRSVSGADLVSVDANHDYRNAYRDLLLAVRASPRPKVIHVDDCAGEVQTAVDDIVIDYDEYISGLIHIDYAFGGCSLIILNPGDPIRG